MRHDLEVTGAAFRLRPVRLDDAAFITALRSDPRARATLHPTSGRVEDQVRWLETYFERPDDWYWIVERIASGTPEGTIGIYDLDAERQRATWGRWILKPESLAAPESALLVYTAAFERIGLAEVSALTVATNSKVVSFHDSVGLRRTAFVANAFTLESGPVDAIEQTLSASEWPATRARLSVVAGQVAAILARGAR